MWVNPQTTHRIILNEDQSHILKIRMKDLLPSELEKNKASTALFLFTYIFQQLLNNTYNFHNLDASNLGLPILSV